MWLGRGFRSPPLRGYDLPVDVQGASVAVRLFSYRIVHDSGAAPNPFWGRCTLAICKPAIRRAAVPGDWVLATGSLHSSVGDLSHSVVYAMRVDDRMSMEDYDRYTGEALPEKIPDFRSRDFRRRAGQESHGQSAETAADLSRPSAGTGT